MNKKIFFTAFFTSYLLFSNPQTAFASWKDYREGKKSITYEELLNYVPVKDIERRALCAALVQILYFREKGKIAIEKGIYGKAWEMHERTKKYSLSLHYKKEKSENLENISKDNLKEGDLIFAKHSESNYPLHVAIYLGENKIIHQFTDPENKKEKPRVEIISSEDFFKKFEFKDAVRPFP